MSPGRLVLMCAIVAVGTFAPQLVLIAGMTLPWWATLSACVVGVAGLVWFIASAPRSYGGTARLVFDQAGATVLPMAFNRERKPGERWTVCTFTGREHVELRQLSDTWAKLRIRKPEGGTLFSGGIQLPKNRHDEVELTLRRLVARVSELDEPLDGPTPPQVYFHVPPPLLPPSPGPSNR